MLRRKQAATPFHQAGVPGNLKHPRFQPRWVSQLIEVFEYIHQRFLRHFFGVLTLPAKRIAIAENLRVILRYELLKRRGAALYQLPGELRIRIRCRFQTSSLSHGTRVLC